MSRVAARTRPGTLVHALIVYAETHMPERPGHFAPAGRPEPARRVGPRALSAEAPALRAGPT